MELIDPSTPHIPLRKCVICGAFKQKKELVRLSKFHDGKLELETDKLHYENSKGVYICRNADCIDRFLNSKQYKRRYPTAISNLAAVLPHFSE